MAIIPLHNERLQLPVIRGVEEPRGSETNRAISMFRQNIPPGMSFSVLGITQAAGV